MVYSAFIMMSIIITNVRVQRSCLFFATLFLSGTPLFFFKHDVIYKNTLSIIIYRAKKRKITITNSVLNKIRFTSSKNVVSEKIYRKSMIIQ